MVQHQQIMGAFSDTKENNAQHEPTIRSCLKKQHQENHKKGQIQTNQQKTSTKKHPKKKDRRMKIMYANANGITGKIDNLKTAAKTHNSHVIAITETKIQGDMPKLEGYEWISKNRTGKEGGGIAIAVRNDLTNNATLVDDLEDQDQEVIWVEIRSGPPKQFIGVYYGTQENSPIEETEREYSQLTTQIHALQQRGGVILTADFDAKLEINDNHIRHNKSRNGKLLGKLIEDTGLTPINTQQGKCKRTRQNRDNPMEMSVIDYILVSKQYVNNIEEINVDKIGIYRLRGKADSDHNTITTTISSNLTTRKRTVEITQINNKEGWREYNKEITRKYKEDPPENYTQLHDLITQTIGETVGIKKIKIGNNNKKIEKGQRTQTDQDEKRNNLQEAQKMGSNQTLIALHEYISTQKKTQRVHRGGWKGKIQPK